MVFFVMLYVDKARVITVVMILMIIMMLITTIKVTMMINDGDDDDDDDEAKDCSFNSFCRMTTSIKINSKLRPETSFI